MLSATNIFKKVLRPRPELVVFHGSATVESLALGLGLEAERVEFHPVTAGAAFDAAALESQQLDQKKRDEMLTDVQDKINQMFTGAKKTGPVQVFLLDGKGLAAGNSTSQATMHALAHAVLTDPKKTLAAFLPETQGQDPADTEEPVEGAGAVTVEGMQSVVADYLRVRQVPLALSTEQLHEFLNNL